MKCKGCQSEVPLLVTPPGIFFWTAAACVAAAFAGFAAAAALPDSTAQMAARVVVVVAAGAAAFSAIGVWSSMIDGCSMGSGGESLGGRQCPACMEVNRIWPWSL